MRYRRVSYRHAVVSAGPRGFRGLRSVTIVLAEPRWRPDADVYETAGALVVVVDLAGVEEDDIEITVFEDALVVEGERRLACEEDGVYHAAAIRQGPFRLEVPLPAPVDPEAVEGRYERGLLRLTVRKAPRT
jgi:HSP20 family protein